MSNYSEFIKQRKENDLKFFFGEDMKRYSNNYIKFTHIKDNDNFIIVTNNIRTIKDSLVMIIGSNKAIYLKNWQVRPLKEHYGVRAFAVKLNRNYFKPYTFSSEFEDFCFDEGKEDSFDSLLEVAKIQEEELAKI